MQSIEFTATVGYKTRHVKLSQPSGAEGWQVFIDKYYHGLLINRGGKWVGLFHATSDLTVDDAQILGERIEQESRIPYGNP